MAFKLKDVVPWGRSYNEYVKMFDLNENELKLKILGCGDGPASFNYECNKRGGCAVSIDPIYHLKKEEIKKRIEDTYDDILNQTRENSKNFKWDTIRSVDELGKIRMKAMGIFLDSYEQGKKEKKYIPASLPFIPFQDKEFDIALSSHFLFLYTNNLSYEFHVVSIREMLRVAHEIRIFPILDVNSNKSPYAQKIIEEFQHKRVEIRKAEYEFQIGGNELLIIKNP